MLVILNKSTLQLFVESTFALNRFASYLETQLGNIYKMLNILVHTLPLSVCGELW